MDGTQNLDIGCQEVTVKNKRVKKTGGSKIFKKLLEILHSGNEKHVIDFTNDDKTEFEVKMTDKKNKKQWTERDISLFLALDSISSKPREQKNLAESTKNRFKSNMTKLERAGYLEYLGPRQVSKAVVYKKYRILKACPIWDEIEEGYSLESTDTESKESSVNDVHTYVTYQNKGSHIYLPEANDEVVEVQENLEGEVQQNLSEKQYVDKPNFNKYVHNDVTYQNEGSHIYLPEANDEVVEVQENLESEVQQNISENQYVDKPNFNNDVHNDVTYQNEGSHIYLPEANDEVVEVQENLEGEVQQNLSEKQYVDKPNFNNDTHNDVTYQNEGSHIYLPEANDEVVEVQENLESEVQQSISENQYVDKPNFNNDTHNDVTYQNEGSHIYLPEANDEVVEVQENLESEVQQNISENQYVDKPNFNKRKLNRPYSQNKRCRELDWSLTKSYLDDVTMFEETEDYNEILKDSTNPLLSNPLLSSALVYEERPGLTSDSCWQNEYKIFSFDPETMYDCI